jgi:hypothetical protein
MQRLGALDGLTAEIQPGHLVAEIGEQGRLMAPAAAGHQHPARWLGCPGVSAQKGLQWRRGLAQLPAITALEVALVPVRCGHGADLSSKPFKRRPVGGALAPVAAVTSSHKVCRSGVCGFTHDLSWA